MMIEERIQIGKTTYLFKYNSIMQTIMVYERIATHEYKCVSMAQCQNDHIYNIIKIALQLLSKEVGANLDTEIN